MKESIVGEVGTLKTSTRKTTIHLENSYTNPVIITSLGGNGWEPYTNRISNIKEDSFDIRIQEPSTGTSPGHTSEISSYMVIEAGVYALEDGSKIQAGTIPSSKTRPHQFPIVNLDKSFDNPDTMLFSQVQSSNGGDWVYSRIHAKEGSRFRVGLQEEELLRHTGHTTEEIGFVALLAGDNSDSFFTKKTTFSNKTFIKTDKDALFAESTSLDGMDPFVTRIDPIDNGYSLRLQEEQSYDLETVHIAESFNIFGADIGNLVSVI